VSLAKSRLATAGFAARGRRKTVSAWASLLANGTLPGGGVPAQQSDTMQPKLCFFDPPRRSRLIEEEEGGVCQPAAFFAVGG